MSNPSASTPAPDGPEFNPHGEQLTRRDWSFLIYLGLLGLLPLIAALVLCLILLTRYPNFDTLPKGPAPLPDQTSGQQQ